MAFFYFCIMNKDECFELGIISKLYSFKGEVILYIDSDEPQNYYNLDAIYLEINNQLIPFFIEKITPSKVNQIRVRFEGIETEEQAKKIIKKKAFLPLSALPNLDDDQFFLHEIEGYSVMDQDQKVIGVASTVIENPGNTLLEVLVDEKEVLLPFNENTIIKVAKDKKQISIEIPEGLLDLYL